MKRLILLILAWNSIGLSIGYGQSITIISPSGSPCWIVGSNQDIAWTSSSYDSTVRIQLLIENDAPVEIAANQPPGGTYSWTVDGSITSEARIRIVADSSDISDTSSRFSISQTAEAQLAVSNENINFGTVHSSAQENLSIQNTGCGNLDWQIDISETSWLRVNQNSGSLNGAETIRIILTATTDSVTKGEYQTTLTVSGGGDSKTVTVLITVPNRPPKISPVNPFDLTVGGPDSLLNLEALTTDPDDDNIVFDRRIQSGKGVLAEVEQGTLLRVRLENPVPGDKAVVEIIASDGDTSAISTFTVSTNFPPTVINPIADQTIRGGDIRVTLFIALQDPDVFGDKDDSFDGVMQTLQVEASPSDIIHTEAVENNRKLRITLVSDLPAESEQTAQVIIAVDDSRGGSAADSFNVTVVSNLPPVINHLPVEIVENNNEVPVSAEVTDDDAVKDVFLNYRKAGDLGFSSLAMSRLTGGNFFQATIPATAVNSRGLEYYITASDSLQATTFAPSDSGTYSTQVLVAGGLAKNERQPDNVYRMLSIPLLLNNQSPGVVLEDDLGKYDDTKWRFFEPQADSTLLEFPTSPMIPGKAFWLIVKDGSSTNPIDTGAGKSVKTDEPFRLSLNPGWNYIGTPYNFALPLSQLSWQSGRKPVYLRSYNNGWQQADTLHPFEGYAVLNDTTAIDILRMNPDLGNTGSPDETAIPAAQKQRLWQVRISARAMDALDCENFAAVHQASELTWDRFDQPEPPLIGKYISVSFPHPEWRKTVTRYAADVRPPHQDEYIWDFQVHSNIRTGVDLTFEELETVPNHLDIWLVDPLLQVRQNLRERNHYRLTGAGSGAARNLKLAIGNSSRIETALQTTNAQPITFELAQNFPNPFNPVTHIRFGLPVASNVTMKVFNLRGEEITTLLANQALPAGYHIATWQGLDNYQRQVSSGLYIYRLSTDQIHLNRKMLLIK